MGDIQRYVYGAWSYVLWIFPPRPDSFDELDDNESVYHFEINKITSWIEKKRKEKDQRYENLLPVIVPWSSDLDVAFGE